MNTEKNANYIPESPFENMTEETYMEYINNEPEPNYAEDAEIESKIQEITSYKDMYEYFKEFGTAEQMKAFIREYGMPDKQAMQDTIKEIKKIRENALVVQSNSLAEASQNLTAVELRIVFHLISYLNPKNEEDFSTTKIAMSDLAKMCQLESKDHYDQIYKACDGIMKKPIIIKTHDRNGNAITLRRTWFVQLDTVGGANSYVLYKFHPDLTDELLQLKKYGRSYVKTQAQYLNKLGDVFPMRFFQLMALNAYKGMAEYSIAEIVNMFQLQGKYIDKRTGKLNIALFIKKVISTAIQKINETTDLHIDIKAIKVGRKIESIQFFITKTKEKQTDITPVAIDLPKKEESVSWMKDPQVSNMLKKLEENGFSLMYRRTVLNKFTNYEDFLTACSTAITNLTTAKNNPNGKPINNPGAFLFSEIMSYDPAKERFFAQEEAAAAEAKHQEERERTTKIEAAETWEDIIKQAKAQTDKEKAIKILQDAVAKKAQLYENYKKAYRLTYPEDPAGYDVDLEISYIRTQGISQLLDKQVNYNLLKTEK